MRGDNGAGHHAQGRVQIEGHGRRAGAVKERAAAELRLDDGKGHIKIVEHVQVAAVGGDGHGLVRVAGVGQLDEAAVGAGAGGRRRAVDVVEAHAEVAGQHNFHLEAGVVRHRVGVGVGPTEAELVVGVDGDAVALGVGRRAAEAEAEHVVAGSIHVKTHGAAAARHVGKVGELVARPHAQVGIGLNRDGLGQVLVGNFALDAHVAGRGCKAGRRGRNIAVVVGVEHGAAGRARRGRLEDDARCRGLCPGGKPAEAGCQKQDDQRVEHANQAVGSKEFCHERMLRQGDVNKRVLQTTY